MYRNQLPEMNCDDFEKMVNMICKQLLGIATLSFSTGPDGGRDGFFEGTASKFPSEKEPLSGKFIIQSKHTAKFNASCSDSDFVKIIQEEIPKLKAKVDNFEVDHYIIFTNRKLTGGKEEALRNQFKDETGLSTVHLRGVETIDADLRQNSNIASIFHLDSFKIPFRVETEDLREVIDKFHDNNKFVFPSNFLNEDFRHPGMTKKNEINNLSVNYFEVIKQTSIQYFADIDEFLRHPANQEFVGKYSNISNEFNCKIMAQRNNFTSFDEVFNFIYDYLCDNCPHLKNKRQLINVFLHYMYYHCDLGLKDNASTN